MVITYQSNTFDIMIKNFFRIKSMMQKLFSLSALYWVHVFVINLDRFDFGINFKHFFSVRRISLKQQ